jgi:L-malate glycosyltransferase
MKVLLVNNARGWGGGQEHLKDLAVELRERGVDIAFTARAGTASAERFTSLGFRVHEVPARGAAAYLQAVPALAGFLRRERFDVVSVNREHDLLLTVLALKLAYPFGWRSKLMTSYHIATSRRQVLASAADAVVCISHHVRTTVVSANPSLASRTIVIHNGIPLPAAPGAEKWNPGRERRFLKGNGFPLIGMVGELWKNQDELIDVVAMLKGEFPSLKLALIGSDMDERIKIPLVAKIRGMALEEDILFTGFVSREWMPDLFHDLDLSVTTFRNEGFGMALVESLAAGTPVVGYDAGGFVDVLREEDAGILVDGGVREFSAAVAELLRDDRRRNSMGEKGYRLVERKYSLQAMAGNYLAFYEKLAALDA